MSRAPRHPFHGLRLPAAPVDLRHRALAAARAVPAETGGKVHPSRRTLTDRLWESGPLRLAWALLLVLLLGTNAYLNSREPARRLAPDNAARSSMTLLEARASVLRVMLDDAPPLAPDRAPRRPS